MRCPKVLTESTIKYEYDRAKNLAGSDDTLWYQCDRTLHFFFFQVLEILMWILSPFLG